MNRNILLGLTLAFGMSLSAFADVDELGKTPTYWYTFDGEIVSKGSASIAETSMKVAKYGVGRDSAKAAKGTGNAGDAAYGAYWPGGQTSSQTYFFDARLGFVTNGVLFSRGGASSSDGNFALLADATLNKVKLVHWEASTHFTTLIEAAVDGISFRFASYAVVYDKTAGTIALYVDGVSYGAVEFSGFVDQKWQFYGVHGGIALVGVQTPYSNVAEFRYYQEALSAADIANLAKTHPLGTLTDVNGLRPVYDLAYDEEPLLLGSERGWAPNSAKYWAPTATHSNIVCRTGFAGYEFYGDSQSGVGFDLGDGSFTMFLSAQSGVSTSGTIFSLGGKDSSANLALAVRGNDKIALCKWNGSTVTELIPVTVCGCHNRFHPYAVVYDASAQEVTLYVDGEAVGTVPFSGVFADGNWGIGQVRGIHSGLLYPTGLAVERASFYRSALTAAQVANLSAEYSPWWAGYSDDGLGLYPTYRYAFNGAPASLGLGELRTSGNPVSFHPKSYPVGRDGRMNANGFTYTTGVTIEYPWGTQFAPGTKSFTLFFAARAGTKAGGVIFGLGKRSDASGNLAFVSDGGNGVKVVNWTSDAETCHVLCSAAFPGAADEVHAYAVVYDDQAGLITLFVDGVQSGDSVAYDGLTRETWQFGGLNGGVASAMGLSTTDIYTIEEFRFYRQALTADQIVALAGLFPPWPRALVWGGGDGSWGDTNWLRWKANGNVFTWEKVAFASGTNAIFQSDSTIAIPEGVMAGTVSVSSNAVFSGKAFACSSLAVKDSGSIAVAGVTARISPGHPVAAVDAANVTGVDFKTRDDYGNGWYFDDGFLRFGKQVRGLMLIFR